MTDVVDRAFEEFARTGGSEPIALLSASTTSPESRVATLRRGSGELRLIWRRSAETLSLLISHGPAQGENAGWLNLFEEKMSAPAVLSDWHDRFSEALSYGLDLMGHERNRPTGV